MNQDFAGSRTTTPTSPPQAGGVSRELSEDAKGIGKAAQEKLGAKAEEGREQASAAVRATSSALDKAVENLRQDGSAPEWLTSGFQKVAREIENVAGSLEGKDLSAITRDVVGFARRNPAAFLGAAAVAGFAAARLLRAGSDYDARTDQGSATSTSGRDYLAAVPQGQRSTLAGGTEQSSARGTPEGFGQ